MADLSKIIEDLSALTVVEAANLVKQLEEKWGVKAASGGGMDPALIAAMAGALAFSRDHEREADRIGVDLMRRTGHDPREAATVWGNLLAELQATPGADPTQESILFATHPPSAERRDTLDALSIGASGDKGEAAWRTRIAPLRRELLADEIKRGRPYETVALTTAARDHRARIVSITDSVF